MGNNNREEMSFLEHLEELRWRFIKAAVSVIICAIPAGIFWKKILDFVMIYPLHMASPRPKLIYTNPSESVILSIKIAIAGGLIIASPIVFYQIWKFISPGLYPKEKKVILPAVFASTFFFILGIIFAYLCFPFLMRFLTSFAGNSLDPMFKIDEYFGFLLKISLSFGLVFELPVISFILARLGLITSNFLVDKFRYAIVLIFIVAAILTPPDAFSQIMLAIPLLFLYGISIIVAKVASKKGALPS
ncbi:MAG: twin-arginine translocase subunit TatC [Chitinispirillaceae bacterium]|nr:twin-arginine translocase subunit TatC [Chitinispirillaceae bacterium]